MKQLAGASGFSGETLGSLQRHNFIIQSWEPIFTHMLNIFLAKTSNYAGLVQELNERSTSTSLFQERSETILGLEEQFIVFTQRMSAVDPNWSDYVLFNAFSYIGVFVAICSSNWTLRLPAIKTMAPVFFAFDQPTYRKLIHSNSPYPDALYPGTSIYRAPLKHGNAHARIQLRSFSLAIDSRPAGRRVTIRRMPTLL